MDNRVQKCIFDILESIKAIDNHLGKKKDFNVYKKNLTIKRAIERELEIIGEAINRIIKIEPSISLSYSRKIVDLRNHIIHSYDNIDDETIWGVIQKHIPVLKLEIEKLVK